MKLSYIMLATSIGMMTLSGCGGSNTSSDNIYPTPTPTPTPVPTPAPAVEFPVQIAAPVAKNINDSGTIITAENGLSLYFFANDDVGVSNCNGVAGDVPGSTEDTASCAGKWPPALAGDGAEETAYYTLVERADGTKQWSFKGFPLYTFSEDSAEGEINGDGVGGVWDLARPLPLQTTLINDVATYTGNETILSAISVGGVLENFRAEKDGFVLYTFDNDTLNDSTCLSEGCISKWPPLLADNGAKAFGMLSLIERSDGATQWAYKSKPLYFFANDVEAGDTNGDNVANLFHVANKLPAIQRTNDAGTQLTATGLVSVLLPNADNGDALEPRSVDKDQFTLYTFDNDVANTSNCNDACAVNWPAFLAPDTAEDVGGFTKITRADGNTQWALDQKPLYFFKNDTAKAQNNGDGIGGVFHIVEPAPVAPAITTTINATNSLLGETLTVDAQVLALLADANGDFVATAVDKTGLQLYTFDNDSSEVSNCSSNGCMDAWPALLASDTDTASAPFSIFTRADGNMQWAVNGMPLYFFASDTAAGEQLGEAVGGTWFVARPAPVRVLSLTSNGQQINGLVGHGNLLPSQGKTADQLLDHTLYTFDDDVVGSGASTCFGSCATTWPPLYASSADQAFGEFEIISRTEADNSQTLQWTYQGQPLYFVNFDSAVGDTNGVYGTWHIALP
jgi:predicted lipoprotein with Yx(FWY)xxD motif